MEMSVTREESRKNVRQCQGQGVGRSSSWDAVYYKKILDVLKNDVTMKGKQAGICPPVLYIHLIRSV